MIRLNQVKLEIDHSEKDVLTALSKKLRVKASEIKSYQLVKRSIDARKKPELYYVCVFDVLVNNEESLIKKHKLDKAKTLTYTYPNVKEKSNPIIIGFGPAGIFAAYIMAELGMKPIVFERGQDVDERTLSVEKFWQTGQLDPMSNVQFGEGGAGTFSDGKLTTRSKDPRAKKVLEILVKHGAPEEILYMNKPHVGTDILKDVVKSMRQHIISLGGHVHFNSYVKDFIVNDEAIEGVILEDGSEKRGQHVVVAVGHSARDTYQVLYDRGLTIEQKPFAMGVRIEHHQEMVDINQYGSLKHREILGASDYKLTYKASTGRSVYSFCVCPGGMVVASSSEAGGLVVNGMSEHARNQKNINGALLVQIQTEDFASDHPLAGVDFQRKYERLAFELGGRDYTAPAETVGSFLNKDKNHIVNIIPSYRPKVKLTSIRECLPEVVSDSLEEALINFNHKIKGFASNDAVLTAIESRSSAPIRMIRAFESMESNIKGLYPIGEGAGFAGGIISSAIDGIKVAENIATV